MRIYICTYIFTIHTCILTNPLTHAHTRTHTHTHAHGRAWTRTHARTGLLTREPEKRLGKEGAAVIKNHPFFKHKTFKWKDIMERKCSPPFELGEYRMFGSCVRVVVGGGVCIVYMGGGYTICGRGELR